MDGRIYYLQVDSRTFYALYFTIASDNLSAAREQIDSVAQSFRLKWLYLKSPSATSIWAVPLGAR